MESPIFGGHENIPLVNYHDKELEGDNDNDYDDYSTPNTIKIGETKFPSPNFTDKQATSTLRPRQKVNRNKLAAMYRHLNVTDDLDLINPFWFNYTKNTKRGTAVLGFYNGDIWVPLKKQMSEFLTPKTLRDRFGGLHTMKNFLGIDETPTALEQLFKAATKLKRELPTETEMETVPLMDLSSLAEDMLKQEERTEY